MDVYHSDDYVGLETKNFDIYYGYEYLHCPKCDSYFYHGDECPENHNENLYEWAFHVIDRNTQKLIFQTIPREHHGRMMLEFLDCLGQYLEKRPEAQLSMPFCKNF